MTLEQFRATLTSDSSPAVAAALQALWHDARGEWDTAHELANSIEDKTGAWVHAYLHRKEGDLGNAAYWYNRAGQSVATDALDAEWDRIARALLGRAGTGLLDELAHLGRLTLTRKVIHRNPQSHDAKPDEAVHGIRHEAIDDDGG